MLSLRTFCENCGKHLPNDSSKAMICTFECTFCKECVDDTLKNVCPNCGGGFEKRPTRPKEKLTRYPVDEQRYIKPVDIEKFQALLNQYKDIPPYAR